MKLLYFITLLYYSSNSLSETEHHIDNLQTFFTSIKLREQLNSQRTERLLHSSSKTGKSSTLHKPVTVNLQGLVIRTNHTPIIFINNHNTLNLKNINNNIKIDSSSTIRTDYRVPVMINQKIIQLKPGQQWSETAMKIIDSYNVKVNKITPPINQIVK